LAIPDRPQATFRDDLDTGETARAVSKRTQRSIGPPNGAKSGDPGKRIVARSGLRRDINGFVVNGSAPELFLVMSLVSIWYTQREMAERRAFVRT
jgi:hypothetical protein